MLQNPIRLESSVQYDVSSAILNSIQGEEGQAGRPDPLHRVGQGI